MFSKAGVSGKHNLTGGANVDDQLIEPTSSFEDCIVEAQGASWWNGDWKLMLFYNPSIPVAFGMRRLSKCG